MLFERWVRQFAKDGIERLVDLRRMAMNGSEQNRRLLIRIEDLDSRTLEVLAKQGPEDVRLQVAHHPNLHEELARSLLDHPRIVDAAFKAVLRQRIAAWERENEADATPQAAKSTVMPVSNDTPTSAPTTDTAVLAPAEPESDDHLHQSPCDTAPSATFRQPPSVPGDTGRVEVFEGSSMPAPPSWTELVVTQAILDDEVHFEPEPAWPVEDRDSLEDDAAAQPNPMLSIDSTEPLELGPRKILDPGQLDLLDALAFADDEDETEAIEIADVPSAPDLDERVEAVLYGIFDRHVDGISPGPALDALRNKIAARRPGGLIRSLRNLILEGADPEAIVLAYAARSYWQDTHVDNGRRFTHLDWRTAVCLMESFDGYPDLDEALQILEKLDHRWRATGCTYSLSQFLQGSMEDLKTYRASGGSLPPDLFFA
jgi:hypothetical protein